MNQPKVTVLGECMLELSSASNQSSFPLSSDLSFGGDTLNTSVYLSRLGISTTYVTALGQDPYSERMLAAWREEGVHCDAVSLCPNGLPGLYAISTDEQGERSFYYWRQQSAARALFHDWSRLGSLLNPQRHEENECELFYLSGITLALCSPDVLLQLFDYLHHFRERGGKVAFDSNYRPKLWPDPQRARDVFNLMYQLTDIALPTLDDEILLAPNVSAESVIESLHQAGVEEIILKQGTLGCQLVNKKHRQFIPLDKVARAVDTTAAGDSFNAGYLAARCRGLSPEEAIGVAQTLSAQVVQHSGAIIPKDKMPKCF